MESPSASALRRDTLADQVAKLLIQSIFENRLRPGDTLSGELEVASRYGVSRPVAREALRHLAALNMVQLANGKVPVIKPLGGELLAVYYEWALQLEESSFVELHELREGVEGSCAYFAALRRTDEDLDELHALLDRMRAEDDPDAFAGLDTDLHVAIARAAHNRLLLHTLESIRRATRDVVVTGMSLMEAEPDSEPPIVRLRIGHQRIVEPIEAGDAGLARARMDEHLRGAVARYIAAFERHSKS